MEAALEEPETSQHSTVDTGLSSHRPTSGESQDISHILANTFKDLYTQGIFGTGSLNDLIKKESDWSSSHDKYVEELQQANSEYRRCIQEADMLESHIIHARNQATAIESQEYKRLNPGGVCDQEGIFTVQSAFSWCVDSDLLEMHNLISPQDYLPTQKPRVRPPPPVKLNPAKSTISYAMHMSKEPQDDGYTLIPSPEKTVLNKSDLSLMFESSLETPRENTPSERPNQSKPSPKWKPSAKEKAEVRDVLKRLKDRHTFLRNPHFLPPNAQHGGRSLIQPSSRVVKREGGSEGMREQSSTDDPVPVFLANPSVVLFTDYIVGHVSETTLELKNLTSSSRHIRVNPPTTPYFSIGLGRFPGEGGVVAPGMSCKYTVQFTPDSLADYEDFILVESHVETLLVVPIAAKRPPPILTLPRILDCGYCLIGGVKFVEFLCRNIGLSAGTFCVIPKNQWPASNLRSVARTYFSEQPPFAISPSLFVLQPGEATVVEVVFFPIIAAKSCQVFTVVCDNCQVKDISIEGEGQMIAFELVSVSGEKERLVIGEVHDLTAEHFVRFSSCNPHSMKHKKIIIRNNVHVELPFHWQIMKPNIHPLLPGETPLPSHIQFHLATDDAFSVSPLTGILAPCQDQEFLLTFGPTELKDYHSVCHLVLRDVPQLQPQPSENSILQPVRTGSKLNDVIVMEIEVKGSTEQYQVLLDPYAVVIPGEIFICTTTKRPFKLWNHSKTFICFQWERMNSSSHIIEVEPSTGRIEQNECFDLDLIVTGGKPERVVTSLVCHIEHRHEPITLPVEVSFKGPTVTVGVPSVDFGLMRLGEQTQTSLLLTNTTQLEASWTIGGSQHDHQDTQMLVEPCRGVLPPLACCSVDVIFKPRFCQQFETELELEVENGTGCHLSVRADVQSPQVCLLNCELLLSELYVGVPAKAAVTLFNQTLLPAHFQWKAQLQGKQASLCSASFDPSSGSLGPNASVEVSVTFTSHTDLELTEMAALCEVRGMNSYLVLVISASNIKELSVTYSLPSVGSNPDDKSPSTILDFGVDVVCKRPVTKQLLMTNQTAIPAPFTIEPEYFSCHASKPNNQQEKRFAYVKKPLHSIQAKIKGEKAHEEFVSSLLAHGKGAAFFVLPNTGTLGPFETLTVDVTAYTDMWGEYRDNLICKVGDLDTTLIQIQMTVTGCPLYFQITGPLADDQNQGPIIQFGMHVSGGDTVSRSLRINNPTMHNIRMDWETYNIDHNDHRLVDVVVKCGPAFPIKDADGNEVLSGALRLSDGNIQTGRERIRPPGSDGSSSSLQSQIDTDEEEMSDGCDENEASFYPFPANEKLFSVHIRPHMGNLSDYPYCITPQQIVIPAKGSGTFHVSFTPLTLSGSALESRCVGLALGFMSLDSKAAACVPGKVERAQGLDLEPLRLDLLAAVNPAVLVVEMEKDDGVLQFHASTGDLQRAPSERELIVKEFDITKSLQLKNTLEMPLHFRLGTQPPFTVLRPQPRVRTSSSSNSPTGDRDSLVLQPQKSMQVKVAFHCSRCLLDHVNQADEDVPPGVTLIQDANGPRKLRFQQNLLIHFSNNSLQTVPLCAFLDLSALRLSTQSINFGFCYVGQMQTREMNLYCCGVQTYWKSVIESDEEESFVFRVTPDFGLLRPNEYVSSCRECLQISFTPSEDREFRATVLIQSPLVKTPLTLQLQGTGSFDEAYSSN
ncbi:deleted in lung and esophageal cancer protein 1 isoform X2 [Pleuronectes platessa]|uniref:deleted in lung and esophageal cancer protein 1 isoform X2 n=1 Tax=Pleuronectes platessa TaxID=8262 RepID=UPI00232A1CFE|nr:deleted in lung and esophageal cancer protein 1 isoform X2 [Pleuronectes platessa]